MSHLDLDELERRTKQEAHIDTQAEFLPLTDLLELIRRVRLAESAVVLKAGPGTLVVFRTENGGQGWVTAQQIRKALPEGTGVAIVSDQLSVESFDAEQMRKAGWVRADAVAVPEEWREFVSDILNTLKHAGEYDLTDRAYALLQSTSASPPAQKAADSADDSLDPLYLDAAAFAQANPEDFGLSAVQRRFMLGYNRASRIIDAMIERGLVVRDSEPSGRYVVVPAEQPASDMIVCKGSVALGSGCGKCRRCTDEIEVMVARGHTIPEKYKGVKP